MIIFMKVPGHLAAYYSKRTDFQPKPRGMRKIVAPAHLHITSQPPIQALQIMPPHARRCASDITQPTQETCRSAHEVQFPQTTVHALTCDLFAKTKAACAVSTRPPEQQHPMLRRQRHRPHENVCAHIFRARPAAPDATHSNAVLRRRYLKNPSHES